ncbi:unnamed protein product [Auanema sp. JU1783]|nr:unnamed protein product [Auanema sp. JU1783]
MSKENVEEGLLLHYITSRIIVLTSPDNGSENSYLDSLQTAVLTVKAKHFLHYKVWSVSRKRIDISRQLNAEDCGWPVGLVPPLDRLCAICKQLEQWLQQDPENVAIVHCRGDRSRAAMIVSAYMHYNAICSENDSIEDRFSMQRYADVYIGGFCQPSLKRYITYFTNLLSGKTRVNSSPIYLHRVSLTYFQGNNLSLKIYERLSPVYETLPKTAKKESKWDIEDLSLRGDVLLKIQLHKDGFQKDLLLCQINTCALGIAERSIVLSFHKEELDLVFADPSVDNRSVLELRLSLDPVVIKSTNARKSIMDTRRNSYDYFPNPEDEATITAEYSEIRKDLGPQAKKQQAITDLDGYSISFENDENKISNGKMPPPVPPKPRSASAMDDPIEMPERRGVLPAQVRPVVAHRPPSPRAAGGRATPSIEPDLVGKDRYDKASKCFSYVSAKALNEAFERPRRPSFSRAVERREDEVNRVDPEDIQRVAVQSSDLIRKTESPKWDDEVERTKRDALMNELGRLPPRSHSVAAQPYYNRRDEDVEEKPVIFDQAQRAVMTTTPTSTLARNKGKYGSYRTLHDDKYSSVMDDLCDPDFYLNYKAPTNSAPQPPPRHAGAKSVELPRRKLQPVEKFTDPLDDILNSSGPAPATSCVELRDRDAFRNRNCRSVAAIPSRDRRLFAENYDAISEAQNPDDWLSTKLKKVRSKRDLDPDLVRRRTQEKMLLEELKNAHDENENTRQRQEMDYTVEGAGTAIDPLADYKREEERLRNTHSPFQDFLPRRGRVRGKPPTPPPRERSRSPGRSERATPSIDSQYNTYKHHNGTSNYNDHDDFDFSTLSSIVQPAHRTDSSRESRSLNRQKSYGASDRPPFAYQDSTINRPDTPTKFVSGQERVAAAIYRAETPQREIYASGTIYRPDTPTRYFPENSSFVQRSQTPAFPVARETPIPFHPLLYNQNGKNEFERSQTLNNRAASPRSQYGQLSRRSSLTSVDTSDIIHHHPVFVKDTSKYWYKPHISREQAINMLRDKHPGTFVVRDSNSFPGAFGLALKVATPPPGVAPGDGTELVRHFLIEPSPKGVKLKGCNNEPVFGSLSALVYQHSITPLALPTRLILPEYDPATTPEHVSATQALLEQGAACNVAYIGSIDVESLTGSECVRRAILQAVEDAQSELTRPVSVHFKVSSQGVTLTDNTRKVFFRRHFPVNTVIYAGMDPSERRFNNYTVIGFSDSCVPSARMFAFVARKPSSYENSCHVFAELEQEQPASAVVNFINKVMLANRR